MTRPRLQITAGATHQAGRLSAGLTLLGSSLARPCTPAAGTVAASTDGAEIPATTAAQDASKVSKLEVVVVNVQAADQMDALSLVCVLTASRRSSTSNLGRHSSE